MNTVELYVGADRRQKRYRYTGPSCWSELSARQDVGVMRLRAMGTQATAGLFPLLTLLYGIPRRQLRWLFDDTLLRRHGFDEQERLRILEQGTLLLDTLSFLNQADNEATFHVTRFRRHDYRFITPVTALKKVCNRTQYLAPTDGLGNSTFAEFIAADMAYRQKDWPLLAAVLYRPAASKAEASDRRIPYDPYVASQQARGFSQLHPALLATVRHSYECSLIYMQSCFSYVFPRTEPTKQAKAPAGNWLDVALGMAKLDVTKLHDIEQVNVYVALKTLNTQLRQAAELEKDLANLQRK